MHWYLRLYHCEKMDQKNGTGEKAAILDKGREQENHLYMPFIWMQHWEALQRSVSMLTAKQPLPQAVSPDGVCQNPDNISFAVFPKKTVTVRHQ